MILPLVTTFLGNPEVQAVLTAGTLWLVNKALGKRANSKLGKATNALTIAASWMAQYAMTEPNKTPKEAIVAFKGLVARAFADAGFTEKDRAPYRPLIDAAISKAVTAWVSSHPEPAKLTMPVTANLTTALP